MEADPNDVICTYLGAGPSGGYDPIGSGETRLIATYGPRGEALAATIAKYLSTPGHPPAGRASNDLAAEQARYQERLRARFPELSVRAANALACYWSFSWR
jgi:hypothetical protein